MQFDSVPLLIQFCPLPPPSFVLFWISSCYQRTALVEIGDAKHVKCTLTFWDEVENTSPNVPEVDHRHIDASKKAKFEQNFVAQLEFVAKVGRDANQQEIVFTVKNRLSNIGTLLSCWTVCQVRGRQPQL